MRNLRQYIRQMILESWGAGQRLDEEDFKDDIDYKFAEYAINERHFSLDSADKEYAKDHYGGLDGVQGGVIYSGGRIGSQEQLDGLKALRDGGTTNVSMKSYSHFKSTAREFADFVKSYDPRVGGPAMKRALERGSAGEFGSYLITIEADEDTIIINTQRPNGVTRHAESELIVDGTVNVVSVEIIAPLQIDTWQEQTIDTWDSLEDLDSTTFLGAWLEHHKVDPWEGGQFEEYLDEMTGTIDGLATLLAEHGDDKILKINSKAFLNEWLPNHPLVDELLDRIELKQGSMSHIEAQVNGTSVSLGKELYGRVLQLKGETLVQGNLDEATKSLENSLGELDVYEDTFGYTKDGSWMGRSNLFFAVHRYCMVLADLDRIGALRYDHTLPLEDFQGFMEEVTEIGLNEQNWKEHFAIVEDIGRNFGPGELTKIMDFLVEKIDSELALDRAMKDYLRSFYQGCNNYREINRWEDTKEFMQKLPDALRACLNAMKMV